ncbi:MUTS HOMOLOG 6-1, ARABIDOPSIS THALIANA MUTS HOMOLOG 6, MUTS homolog 6 [Hibiscus trionum]|uniref:MUTS HOMOLOG 6-1, ARABIDOPSIS THALIANA MUTS HOMOLOG 6, MUTS homolog 6 n=1 Tax=Hibiscus trionum TaxID=183268 RepID=A0A9W7MGI5_HIBTR|nr:MUTS HOMOLOG 6-1, ARABIDOPSIS THALIANA MUTS HOMOLOG 6, MUTS homolog 6 [Hibiscus trionum]
MAAANSYEDDEPGCLPAILSSLLSASTNGSLALGGTLYYLKQAFLDVALLRFANHPLASVAFLENLTRFLMLLPLRSLRSSKTAELETLLGMCACTCGENLSYALEFPNALSRLPDMDLC